MASFAESSPIQTRYTAGVCTLEVTSQPLALSKWYPQPIVQNLQFQLWMRTDKFTDPVLIAEGDRLDLQTISHSVSQQIQSSLMTARLGRRSEGRRSDPSGVDRFVHQTSSTPPLQISQPLSYLQLSDLASVLAQYDQSVRTLPVDIPVVQASAVPDRRGNVIPISTARRPAAVPRSQRRTRATVWASSAAALLLAVGLANALRPNAEREQQVAISSADRVERSAESDAELEAAMPSSPESDSSAPDSLEPNRAAIERPFEVETNVAAPPISSATTDTPLPGDTDSTAPVPSVPSASVPSASVPSRTPSPPPSANTSTDDLAAAEKAPSPALLSETVPDIAALPSEPAAGSTAGSTSRPIPEPPSSDEIAASDGAEAPAAFTLDDLDMASESDSTELETSARMESRSQRVVEQLESGQAVGDQAAGEREMVRLRVSSYFQARWQTMGESISAPIIYDLQLSERGEVVRFVALDEVAQSYRDRLLPLDSPPQFSPAVSELILRIEIKPDGRAVVVEN